MTLDILAISPHPDDVELACGGTLARAVESGARVGLLHLTRGEAGTAARSKSAKVKPNAPGAPWERSRSNFWTAVTARCARVPPKKTP